MLCVHNIKQILLHLNYLTVIRIQSENSTKWGIQIQKFNPAHVAQIKVYIPQLWGKMGGRGGEFYTFHQGRREIKDILLWACEDK